MKKFEFAIPTLNIFCVGGTFGITVSQVIIFGIEKSLPFLLGLFPFQIMLLAIQIRNYNANQKEDKPEIKRNFGEKPIPPPSKLLRE